MLFWILLLVLVSIAYALLITWVLPKFILKSNYSFSQPSDRGLKKYKFSDNDYAIVYEPAIATRKYITQYILAKKDGKKTFKGKIDESVSYIDFDIVLFDASGRSFDVINSMHIVENDGFTEEIELPEATSYASIMVNQVDKKELKRTQVARVTSGRLWLFGGLALLSSIGMSVCTMYAFSNLFGGLFRESFIEKMVDGGWVFIVPTIICALCIYGACYTLSKNSKR